MFQKRIKDAKEQSKSIEGDYINSFVDKNGV